MAGRWTFVLVIALACAMVTAKPIPDVFLPAKTASVKTASAKTSPAQALWEEIALEMGDRLSITCTTDWEEFEMGQQEEGVLVGQDRFNYVIALDGSGAVKEYGKRGLFQNPTCFVKRGIVLKTGDWLKITEKGKFEGKFGRLGRYSHSDRGFQIALEDTAKIHVFKGAYLVTAFKIGDRLKYICPDDMGGSGDLVAWHGMDLVVNVYAAHQTKRFSFIPACWVKQDFLDVLRVGDRFKSKCGLWKGSSGVLIGWHIGRVQKGADSPWRVYILLDSMPEGYNNLAKPWYKLELLPSWYDPSPRFAGEDAMRVREMELSDDCLVKQNIPEAEEEQLLLP